MSSEPLILFAETPLTIFLKPSDLINTFEVPVEDKHYILFFPIELEIIIFLLLLNNNVQCHIFLTISLLKNYNQDPICSIKLTVFLKWHLLLIDNQQKLTMKSIKDLTPQSNRQKPSQLASIDGGNTMKNKRQRLLVTCAFHPTQAITNFCKNMNCLLPLCPKCVRIHIDEHAQTGTLAKFQAIEDCLDQAHAVFLNSFAQISKLQKTSIQIQDNYQRKKENIFKDFERAKLIAFDYLDDIFKDYEEAIKLQMAKDDRVFTEHLIQYHDCISSMMENCRNATKKFNSKSTLMEGLIGFYSKGNYSQSLRLCEQKLNKLTISKVQVITLEHSLEKMKDVIRKYIRVGENSTSFQQLAYDNKTAKSINLEEPTSKIYTSGRQLNRQRANAAISMINYSESGRDLSEFLKDNFLNVKTPLDNFSLERSRDTRVSLGKKFNTDDS